MNQEKIDRLTNEEIIEYVNATFKLYLNKLSVEAVFVILTTSLVHLTLSVDLPLSELIKQVRSCYDHYKRYPMQKIFN